MSVSRDQFALNAIQWIHFKQPDGGPKDQPIWLYNDPAWRSEQPKVHAQIKEAGFGAVMMEVLSTQTLQNYQRMLETAGLRPAAGFVDIGVPAAMGFDIPRGSAEWVHWFDGVRRRAEETNFMGLSTVFVSSGLIYPGNRRLLEQTAVGAFFDSDLLKAQVEVIAEAAEVLKAEGVRAGLHNHVGSLIETEEEIEYALANIDPDVMGASLDVGHLAWAGIDYRALLRRHQDRLVDLHIKDLDVALAEKSRAIPAPYFDVTDDEFFKEPGRGDLDLGGVIDDLGSYGFNGWVIIEVDRATMDPFESAKTSWKWVTDHVAA